MASLKIKNERVYVIYHNGKPYEAAGRKLVYTGTSGANNVITTDAQEIARNRFEFGDIGHNYWWDLTKGERAELVEAVRKEFEVVEYGPISKREG